MRNFINFIKQILYDAYEVTIWMNDSDGNRIGQPQTFKLSYLKKIDQNQLIAVVIETVDLPAARVIDKRAIAAHFHDEHLIAQRPCRRAQGLRIGQPGD